MILLIVIIVAPVFRVPFKLAIIESTGLITTLLKVYFGIKTLNKCSFICENNKFSDKTTIGENYFALRIVKVLVHSIISYLRYVSIGKRCSSNNL